MNTGAVLFANNASSRLYALIDAATTSIRVLAGEGVKFPQPAGDGSNWFMVTVEDRRTGQIEIMKCTGRSGDILNVTRAQEATTGQAFALGSTVSNRLTAGTMDTFFNFNGYSQTESDVRYVNVDGDTMTGPLVLPAAPTLDLQAATKRYVDDVSIDEAPTDGRAYARVGQDASWLVIGTGLPEAPNDGVIYGRQSLGWIATITKVTYDAGVTSTTNAITDLQTRMTTAENTNDAQDSSISANQLKNTQQDNRITAVEGVNTTQDTRLTSIETLNTTQDGRLTAIETLNTTQDGRLTAVESKNTTQDSNLTTINADQITQNNRLTAVESKNTSQDTALATEITNRQNADTALQANINLKADILSPTFTGDPKAPTPATADNDTSIATTAFVKVQGYLTDAPVDGFVYGRKNNAWSTVIGGAATNDTPPAGPLQDGQLWWKSDTGVFYIWYDDGNTQQWVQAAGAATLSGDYAVKTADRRNRVSNPSMQVSQENGDTASATATTGNYFAADQWSSSWSLPGTAFFQRGRPADSGNDYVAAVIGTASASIAAAGYQHIITALEGLNVKDLQWGTANALQAVLRFRFRTSVAGTYTAFIKNGTPDRSYLVNFTALANTWQVFSFIIPGDTTGTWAKDNTVGAYLGVGLSTGTNYQGVAGWQAGNMLQIAGASNLAATAGASAYLTDIGLYADPDQTGIPPRFEVPDYGTELVKCQRYWQIVYGSNRANAPAASNYDHTIVLPVNTRAAPITGITAGSRVNVSSVVIVATGNLGSFRLEMTSTGAGDSYALGDKITFNARM